MILITGSQGVVGSYCSVIFDKGEIFPTDRKSLDITDKKNVRDVFEKIKPDFVIHLAAMTDVDRCEKEQGLARRYNIQGTENIAIACKKYNTIPVFISTTEVFDGKKEFYTEEDIPNPVNFYGKTKIEGEKIIRSMLERFYIVRTCWLFGGGTKDKKFVGKIVSQIKKGEKIIKAVDDLRGSPTYTFDLVEAIRALIKTDRFGIYHITNDGICSRYEMAKQIVKILHSDVKVIPVLSSFFNLPADRGMSVASKSIYLQKIGLKLRRWADALSSYIEVVEKSPHNF